MSSPERGPDSGRDIAAEIGRAGWQLTRWLAGLARKRVIDAVGGPARARVITLFACVLALSSADTSTIGSIAPQLKSSLHITNLDIALLSSATLVVGAIFVIPFGLLVDRARRVPILAVTVVLWSLASFASAIAGSYSTLLLTRLVMGAVTASAGPAIASLTGDYFPSRERGRIYAYILGGEIGGTAVGFTFSGLIASISWRLAFVLLAVPGLFLARALWSTLPEPRRGGQSRLSPGVLDLRTAVAAGDLSGTPDEDADDIAEELAHQRVRERGVEPDRALVLNEDPLRMSLGRAVRYILAIPTNMQLIISSALGYFFFAGLLTFMVLFMEGHYHIGQAKTSVVLLLLVIAAVIGTLVSGRVTDVMVRRGFVEARIWVPAVCYLGAVVMFVPGILITTLTPALWFDMAGAALLSAANPPLDAARLDIMPAGLWGRAESVRTLARSLSQALGPLLFGLIADAIAGLALSPAPIGAHPNPHQVTSNTGTSLEWSFLILLATLAGAGWFMLRARHTYARDIATAAASQEAVGGR
ncbi:MAG TPA: MFS transporter [Solirubrobacteraceae bacterium]|nr:MFS transporter [Solirubrobacteraceae bacterium]